MCLCAVRVQVLRDGDVHHDRLREAGRFEQLVVVNQQLANGVEVGEEATEQTRHLRQSRSSWCVGPGELRSGGAVKSKTRQS
eukprot:1574075-Pleurochrysis_carterae.AAC.1